MPRGALLAAVALGSTTCSDGPSGPGGRRPAHLALQPEFAVGTSLAAFGIAIDSLRVIVVRPATDTIHNQTYPFPADSSDLNLPIAINLIQPVETLTVVLEFRGGGLALFTGTQQVEVQTGPPGTNPAATIPVVYSGPGVGVDSLELTPDDSVLSFSDSLRFRIAAFQAGVPVTQFYVSWTTSDTLAAQANAIGLVRAPALRRGIYVIAQTPTGVRDSTKLTFQPVALALTKVSGDIQSGLFGTLLPQPLRVRVLAADGLGVRGTPVTFTAVTGGGSVASAIVITDSLGFAETGATLGGGLGANSFSASVAGLIGSPATFTATAVAGVATQLAFTVEPVTATAGVAFTPAVQVTARDGQGNVAVGFTGTVTIALGANPGGALNGVTSVPAVAGVATFSSLSIIAAANGYSLVATSGALTPDTSVVFSVAAAAAANLWLVSGDAQNGQAGIALAAPLVVLVTDQFGNPVPGYAAVAWATPNGGSLTPAGPTDALGHTSATWTLGAGLGSQAATATATGLTGSPVGFAAASAPVGTTSTWTGAVSTDWLVGGNWLPNGVPSGLDNVFVPAAPANQPALISAGASVNTLVVQSGASVTTGGFGISVTGDVDATGPITGTGTLSLTGAGTVRGTVPHLSLFAPRSLSGPLTVTGNVILGSDLTINGQKATITGAVIAQPSRLVMTSAADTVDIGGQATFATDAPETGLLTAGVLVLRGNLLQAQAGSGETATFAASGSHKTVFAGSTAQSVTFQNPGASYFRDVEYANAAGVTFASDVQSDGAAVITAGTVMGSVTANLTGSLADAAGGRWQVATTLVAGTITLPDSLVTNLNVGTGFLAKRVTTVGNVQVFGDLTVGGQRLVVRGNLAAQPGRLLMTNLPDTVEVTGGALFQSDNGTGGTLIAGALILRGGFNQAQAGTGQTGTFAASGSHKTVFAGSAPQFVTFANAGASFLHDVEFANGAGVDFTTNAVINGAAVVSTGTVTGAVTVGLGGSASLADAAGGRWQVAITSVSGNVTLPDSLESTVVGSGLLTKRFTTIGSIQLTGDLAVNGQRVRTYGTLTAQPGRLVMTNPADTVDVGSTATFQSDNTSAGVLTAGALILRGGFLQAQAGTGQTATFAPSGAHQTVFAGTGAQTIGFANPGASFFNRLTFANSGTFTLGSAVSAQGALSTPGGVTPTVAGSGQSLAVAGLDVNGLTFDNVTLTSSNGTLTRFDNVTFQNVAATATQLTISHPGTASPVQFTNTTFLVAPTSGFYVAATDNTADANVLTINMVGAAATNGPTFTQLVNGAVVNWSNLAFTASPGTVTAGVAITPAVQVTVNFPGGGVDTTYSGTVTLTLGANPGGATLGGTTAKAAVAGVATFDDLTLDKAAAGYTLQAAASGVGTVFSTAFNVVAGAASAATSLVSVASPSVGVGLTDSLFLQTRDAFDNPILVGGATVVFTQSGTGTGTISSTADRGDGTYAAEFTATALGPVTIGATINGSPVTTTLPTLNVVTVSTTHSADITSTETWTAAQSPHIVTGYLRVRNGAMLTIESGATVKFDAAAGLQVGDSTLGETGTLNMVGSPSEILLTANTGTPTPGFWKGIEVQRPGTFIPWFNVTFEYGGSARAPLPPSFTAPESCFLMVGSVSDVMQVDSSRFRHCVHAGIHHFGGSLIVRKSLFDSTSGSAIHADFDATVQVDSNVFQNSGNEGLQILSPTVTLNATGNQFLSNGAFGASLFATQLAGFHRQAAISGNGNDSIYVQGGRVNTTFAAFTIEAQPAPYLVDGLIEVGRSAAGGVTVTLDSGLVMTFTTAGGLQVGDSSGTQRAQIRSLGTAANPSVLRERPGGGAWRGLGLGLSATPDTLRHVLISGGGGSGGVFGAASAANLTIYKPTAGAHFFIDSIVSDQSAAAGIVVARASSLVSPRHRIVRSTITNTAGDGLVISTTGTQPTVLDSLNTFSGIGGFPLVLSGHALAGHTAQASIDTSGPGQNDILITSGQVFISNVHPPAQIPYATADSALLLQGGGGVFTLDPNLVMKFGQASGLVIGDSAIGPAGTIISLGTNRTNSPLLTSRQAAPQPGDWYGLEIGRLASNTRLANVRIEYAGDSIPGRNAVRFGLWARNAQPLALEIDSVVLVKNGAPSAPGRAVAGLVVTGSGTETAIRRSVIDTTQGGAGVVALMPKVKVVDDTIRGNAESGLAAKLLFGLFIRSVTDSVAGNVVTGNGTYPLDLVPGVLQGVYPQSQVTGNGRDTILIDGPGMISDTARLWKYAGVPYRVTGSILIDSGGALTIEPADTVVFDDSVSIQVGVFGIGTGTGRLRAMSSGVAPILLTANPAAPGRWFGITFFNVEPDGYTRFQNVIVEKAWHSLPCFGDCSPPNQPSLLFYSQSGAGILLDSITVRGALAGAIQVNDIFSGGVTIDNSQFYQNPFSPMIQGALLAGSGSKLQVNNSDLYHYRGNAIRGFYGGGQTGSPADTIDASGNWWGDLAGPTEFNSFSDSLGRASLDQNAIRYQAFATAPHFPVGPAAALLAATDTMVPGDTVGQVIDFSLGPSPDSLRVRVIDAFGRAVPGHSVSWATLSGSANPGGGTSDASGRVATQWTSGTLAGLAQLTANAGLGPQVQFSTTLFADATASTQWRLIGAGPGGTIASDSLSVSYTSSNRSTVLVTRAFDQHGNPTQPTSGYFYSDVPSSGFQFYGQIDSVSQDSLVYFRPRSAVPGTYQFHALYNGGLIQDSVVITIAPNVYRVGIDLDPFALGVQDTGTAVINSLCPFGGPINFFCAKSYTAYVVDSGGAPLPYGGAVIAWTAPPFPDTTITNDSTQGANGEIAYLSAHNDGLTSLIATDVLTGKADTLPVLVDQIGRFMQFTPDTGVHVLVGQTATFTAAILDDGGQPLANDTIHFRVDPFEKLSITDSSILNQVTVHLDSTPFGSTFFEGFWARPAADSVYGYFPNDTVFGVGLVVNPVGVSLPSDVTPDAIAIDEVQNRIFASHLGGTTLAVIDGVGDTVTQFVNIGEATRGLAVNPKTGLVYVTGASGPDMHVVADVSGTYTDTGSVTIGPSQGGIAVDTARNRIYVPSNRSGAEWLTVVDGATNTVIDSIPLAHPGGEVAYNPAIDRIYVALPQSGTPFDTLMVIDAATLTKVDSIEVGDMPAGIAIDPTSNAVYVSNTGSNSITHIDGATNTVIITVATGFFGPGRIGFDPGTSHVWVSTQSTFVEVFDTALTFVGSPNIGQTTADAKVNPVTGKIYLTVPNLDAVRILKF